MKKTFSALLIGTFIIYAIYVHAFSENTPIQPLAKPPVTATAGDSGAVALGNATPNSAPAPSVPAQPEPAPAPAKAPAPAPAPAPASSKPAAPAPAAPKQTGQYKDGTYVGQAVDAYYGTVQVEAIIKGGRLADVQILDYPQDRRTSQYVNGQALPILVNEAIQSQSANVDAVSGASETTPAFKKSLSSALSQAKI